MEIVNDFGVYVPNTFTPNSDGMNDAFQVIYYGVKEARMDIFDRWGIKIFSSEDMKGTWNGNYNGKDCQVGT